MFLTDATFYHRLFSTVFSILYFNLRTYLKNECKLTDNLSFFMLVGLVKSIWSNIKMVQVIFSNFYDSVPPYL